VDYLKYLLLTDYTLGDFSTTTNGVDLVATYTARVTGTYKCQPLPSESLHMMTVWQEVTKTGGNRAQ